MFRKSKYTIDIFAVSLTEVIMPQMRVSKKRLYHSFWKVGLAIISCTMEWNCFWRNISNSVEKSFYRIFVYSSVPNRRPFPISIQDGNCLRIFFSELIKHTSWRSFFTGFFVRFLRFYKKLTIKEEYRPNFFLKNY